MARGQRLAARKGRRGPRLEAERLAALNALELNLIVLLLNHISIRFIDEAENCDQVKEDSLQEFLKYINRKKNDNSCTQYLHLLILMNGLKDITSTINSIKNNDIKKYCEKIVSNRKKAMMIHDAISNKMKKKFPKMYSEK